ncbi:MAG: YCF48-related protein [Patescibacteria group bacterium]
MITPNLTSMRNLLFASAVAFVALFFVGGGEVRAASADWVAIQTPSQSELSGISCPDARTCYIVSGLYLSGGSGSIVKTTDGGDTFTLLSSPTLNPLHAISCPTVKTCYAAGDFGTFLKTTDSGVNWVETFLGNKGSPPQFSDILAIDEQKVLVVGRDGVFFRSEDGGATWGRPTIKTVADLTSIYFIDASSGLLAGNGGVLLKTKDGGASWEPLGSLRSTLQLWSIRGNGSGTLYAAGDMIRKSTDGGETWTTLSAGLAKNFLDIAAQGGSAAYMLANTNAILKTTDSGATWSEDASLGNTYLRAIACPDTAYCIALGSSGKIFRLGTPPAAVVTPPLPPPVPAVPEPITPAPAVVAPAPTPAPAPVDAPTSVTSAVASPETDADTVTLSRTLKKGSRGEDVKKLQGLLAAVGLFSKADIADVFGPKTVKAVGKFQEKYELASPGDGGYGQAGPKTRAKLIKAAKLDAKADITAADAVETSQTTSAIFARTLKKGSEGSDVKKLQEILSADAEVYPEGDITGYFGPATKRAVGKFQEKHGIASPDDAGYGDVGPKTRAKFKALLEGME